MRYTGISTYDMTRGTFDELTGIAEKGILPTFANLPGFLNFGLADIGDHKVVSISVWESREAADEVLRSYAGSTNASGAEALVSTPRRRTVGSAVSGQ